MLRRPTEPASLQMDWKGHSQTILRHLRAMLRVNTAWFQSVRVRLQDDAADVVCQRGCRVKYCSVVSRFGGAVGGQDGVETLACLKHRAVFTDHRLDMSDTSSGTQDTLICKGRGSKSQGFPVSDYDLGKGYHGKEHLLPRLNLTLIREGPRL